MMEKPITELKQDAWWSLSLLAELHVTAKLAFAEKQSGRHCIASLLSSHAAGAREGRRLRAHD